MLSIAGGQLTVIDVHWELDLPRDVPADRALFEARRAELLRFEKCTFTIRNATLGQTAYHAGVAFFDVKAPPGSGNIAMDTDPADDQVVSIELQNCLARGEAAFVRDNDLQPLRLTWDNGLLATSEHLLVADGGPSQPRRIGHVQLNLRHVTAMLNNGLALLTNSDDAPYQLLTEINCTDSILVSTAKPPLIEQRGTDTTEEYLSRLQWSGDHDFFDGFEVFWQIANGTAETDSQQMRFEDWQKLWASRSKLAANVTISWRRPPQSDRAFHTHTPLDYALDATAADNPAIGGAGDGLDAGCVSKQLSVLPPEERTETKVDLRPAAPVPRKLDGS